MADGRGLPLLSGPPPSGLTDNSEMACRKCNKEFNVIFTRSRKCNHCSFSYCHSCSDFQALMPRGDREPGYTVVPVCSYCIDHLNVTAAGKGHLRTLPLNRLKKYVDAYNIEVPRALEKDDLIDSILAVRESNGCLPRANEEFYRKYSVPNRTPGGRPRGIFSRRGTDAPYSSSGQHPPPAPPNRRPSQDNTFPRPDLDSYWQQQQQPGPPPPQRQTRPQQPQTPQRPAQPQAQHSRPQPPPQPPRPQAQPHPPQPPPRPHSTQPQYNQGPPRTQPQRPFQPQPQRPSPPQRPRQPQREFPQSPNRSRTPHPNSSSNSNETTPQPPRQRASSAAPAPSTEPSSTVPTIDQLLGMTSAAIAGLSISTLKAILFQNHVNAGVILEKGDLVSKVKGLVDEERRDRAREEEIRRREAEEQVEAQRVMLEEHRQKMEKEEATRGGGDESPIPPKAQAMAASLERNGLCVICQDEEANIAIVDCGHLALCRGCSELIMSSSRECPLCRTRIVTEGRLLRIFKT